MSTTDWATGPTTSDDIEDLDDLTAAPAHKPAPAKALNAATSAKPGPGPTEQAPRARRSTGAKAAVERTLALARLERRQRELLASMLSMRDYRDSDPDIVRLVVACVGASSPGAALAKLVEVANAEPLEAGVLATELAADKSALAAVWAALGSLGAVSGSCPSSQARAGLAIAKAAQGLQRQALDDLSKVVAAVGD